MVFFSKAIAWWRYRKYVRKQWRSRVFSQIKIIIRALFDILVVVTVMTTAALIIGVLGYAQSRVALGGVLSPWVWKTCLAIGVLGFVTIAMQVVAILKREHLKRRLAQLIETGHIYMSLFESTEGIEKAITDWANRTERCLEEHFGRGYVFRFRSDSRFIGMTFHFGTEEQRNLYKSLYIRVTNLETIIGELGNL